MIAKSVIRNPVLFSFLCGFMCTLAYRVRPFAAMPASYPFRNLRCQEASYASKTLDKQFRGYMARFHGRRILGEEQDQSSDAKIEGKFCFICHDYIF
jgi:hypothetical protein